MKKRDMLRGEFFLAVFVVFFIISFATDVIIYKVVYSTAFGHGLLYGVSSLAVMVIIKIGDRKRLF